MEAWVRWFAHNKLGIMRDIDQAWRNYGLDAYIGTPYNYWLVASVCSMPFVLICTLLCCIDDGDDFDKPQYRAGDEKKEDEPKKKSTVRAEKLD